MTEIPFDFRQFMSRNFGSEDLPNLQASMQSSKTPFEGWTVEENQSLINSRQTNLKISSGLIRLDASIDNQYSMLKWDALIPSELTPHYTDAGIDLDWLKNRFMAHLFNYFPNKMGIGRDRVKETEQYFRENSRLDLEFSGQEPTKFPVKSEWDLATLVQALSQKKELKAVGLISEQLAMGYSLKVEYPDILESRGQIALLLPVSRNGSTWTPSMAKWILDSHYQRRFLENPDQAAKQLAGIMAGQADKAYKIKHGFI